MSASNRNTGGQGSRRLSHGLAALAFAWGGGAFAQEVVAVPAAHLHHAEGSVAYAPQGDKEWHDVQPRRLLKRGDRLWIDRGSRAEVQAGGHALRLNGETQLVLENVGETATQLSLTQGSVVATVTRLHPGDSFELGTPNLAFRARQPGDYRIDVDTRQGVTRVVVLSGSAVVYGAQGEALEVRNGQRVTFKERSLTRVQQAAFAATDDFDRWAGARRRGEPTVSMPNVASASPAAPAPHTGLVNKGRDIVIAGPASGLPGARPAAAAAAQPAAKPQLAPAAMVPAPQLAKAQPIPNVQVTPNASSAVPLRVTAPGANGQPQASGGQAAAVQAAQAAAQAQAIAQAQAQAAAQARAAAQAQAKSRAEADARARQQAEAEARARQLADAAAKAQREQEQRQRADAKRSEDRRRTAAAAKRAEEERRQAQAAAKREQEHKRMAAARRAEDERRALQAKRAAEEKRLAAARKVEAQKIADARRRQLARLQEQAKREEQSVQARREQLARRAEEERREEQARREDQARREEQYRREDQARREEAWRRERALAEQARRDHERREQEVWLRQQQVPQPYPAYQPQRPAPMGVPARRVS